MQEHLEVVSDPQAQVGIERFAEYGIELGIRFWIPTKKYFELKYDVNKKIYATLQDANITLPYPKQTIDLIK